ncbi:MAG: hypothetical protein MUC88_12985 [Planctomycetes bacterium]|nr:hypothetical protein [Planctomycetota bacterium]
MPSPRLETESRDADARMAFSGVRAQAAQHAAGGSDPVTWSRVTEEVVPQPY